WLGVAESLKRASDLLRATWLEELQGMHERFQRYMRGDIATPWEPWVGAPAMTLAAFAIENLLKGLMIAADPGLVQPNAERPEELLDRRLQTHKLTALADRAGIQLSPEE